MKIFRAIVCGAAVGSLVATPAMAEKARELQFINGMDAPRAERELFNRGFKHIKSHRNSRDYVYSYWWDERDDKCVYVEVYERNNRVESVKDAKDQDCGHHMGGDAGTVAAVGVGAALLGALIGGSKSHHKDDKQYDQNQNSEFDRGYRDGLHNGAYHNYSRSDAYSHGYEKGVDEREANLRHHQRRGGYAQNCPSDLRGSECEYYMDGYRAGASDGSAGMSMAYERHDGYDSRFEPYFARGYADGWRRNR